MNSHQKNVGFLLSTLSAQSLKPGSEVASKAGQWLLFQSWGSAVEDPVQRDKTSREEKLSGET